MNENPPKPPPNPSGGDVMACPYCRQPIAIAGMPPGTSFACPSCRQPVQAGASYGSAGSPYGPMGGVAYDPRMMEYQAFVSKKVAAGVCGILLGGLGVHKFVLGFTQAGVIMLVVNLLCIILTPCLFVPVLGSMAIQVIGLVEGILYLTKSDEEFYNTYAVQRRDWF